MRGHYVRTERTRAPELRLISGVIHQAILDAQRGRPGAAEWLDTVGCDWAACFLGLDITNWRLAARSRGLRHVCRSGSQPARTGQVER